MEPRGPFRGNYTIAHLIVLVNPFTTTHLNHLLYHKYYYMSSAHCAFGATGTLPAKGYDSFEAPDFGGLFFAPKWHIEFQYMENRW